MTFFFCKSHIIFIVIFSQGPIIVIEVTPAFIFYVIFFPVCQSASFSATCRWPGSGRSAWLGSICFACQWRLLGPVSPKPPPGRGWTTVTATVTVTVPPRCHGDHSSLVSGPGPGSDSDSQKRAASPTVTRPT